MGDLGNWLAHRCGCFLGVRCPQGASLAPDAPPGLILPHPLTCCSSCAPCAQRGTLDALDELDQMASMPKLKLAANWVVKLGDLKTSAASSMAKFPLHTVGGGGGG